MTAAAKATTFDLDSLERDTPNLPPFSVKVAGKEFTLSSPDEIDWEIVRSAMMNPGRFLDAAVPTEQVKDFRAAIGTQKSWKIEPLIEAWTKHYGLPDFPE